ncbi:MAG: TetR/AcrR family transcriptional regulator [Ignavibacteria bacterium]
MKNNPKKSLILKAAHKRFARHGLVKTTLEEISRDLRIGKASIYNYFDSKDDIFHAVLQQEVEKFIQELNDIFDNVQIIHKTRLLNYIKLKERIREKYILLYNILISMYRDFLLEPEIIILKLLLEKEETVISGYFLKNDLSHSRLSPLSPSFIVNLTWGLVLTSQFDIILNKSLPGKNIQIFEAVLNMIDI